MKGNGKMSKKKKIIIGVSILIIICIVIVLAVIFNRKDEKENNSQNNYTNIDKKNELSYQNDVTVGELKEETGLAGDDSIYQVDTEFDGRKTLNVKHEIQFKVALVGILLNDKPEYENVDNIINQSNVNKNGVWVEEKSREKLLANLKQITESDYEFSNEGYLNIVNKEKQNDYDKKLETLINSQGQYIFAITDKYYEVDTVSGEVVEYPYQQLDPYQEYDLVEDGDSKIIFINTNSDNNLDDLEIMKNVINDLN